MSMSTREKLLILSALCFISLQVSALYFHEPAQGVDNNSEILSIKIEYDDTITSTHPFPDSFWIQITSNKTGYDNKLEFEVATGPLANKPAKFWISDADSESGFTLHEDTDWDKESWAIYKLVNGGEAFGVAALIKNEDASENKFRMLGSITFGNNYIEITPVITKEQQARNEKRSTENAAESFDAGQNTHLVEVNEYPEIPWTEPVRTGSEKQVSDTNPSDNFRKSRQTTRQIRYVETAAVIDKSIIDFFVQQLKNSDRNSVQRYTSLYYTFIFTKVNSYYEKSFENNTQTSFSVILTGILIYDDSAQATWADSYLFGRGAALSNGVQTLDAKKSLEDFAAFMKKTEPSLSFTFDVAAAFVRKELYVGRQYDVGGQALFRGVCDSDNKYSLNIHRNVAMTSYIAAHEIGHNLGAEHDMGTTKSACPSSGRIMGAVYGDGQTFSTCSMQAFITTTNMANKRCLLNTPKPISLYNDVKGLTFV